MDATTITGSSFTLTPSGGSPVAASVSYDGTSNTATLTPSAALASGTTYTAKLDTTIKATDGTALSSPVSWSFTTITGPPTVTSTTPADGATGVATSIAPTATFSRDMDATTITSSSFTLTGPSGAVAASVSYNATTKTATLTPSTSSSFTLTPSGGSAVAATVSYNATTNTATLTPSSALANSTNYTANLSTSIR